MNLSHISVKRPITTIMVLLMVFLIGTVSLVKIPQDLFPDIQLPIALVMINYPNASPEEVETMITKPIEEQLAAVENLDSIYSLCSAGSSVTAVKFSTDTDMNFATLNMREKIALVQDYLPDEASDPIVMKMDMNAAPIMQIYISGDMSLTDLYNKIDGDVTNEFKRVDGVASVSLIGGIEEEVAINFDQERLNGYGLTLSAMSQMLSAENLNRPSGTISKGSTEVIVRTMGEFKNIEELAKYPITLPTREIINLQDISTISMQQKEQESISRVDGRTGIGVIITKQSVGNTVDVCKAVQKTLQKLEEKNPDLHFTIGFNQADFIQNAVSSVATSGITGAILAIILIFLFLRNFGSTMVMAISIPSSFL
ncbi:MAG: efflux RND transporter permease subunit, partial [Anaerovorax sp.]|nr:efflux RND transporter permease subunit [Anaerovorax sp.]